MAEVDYVTEAIERCRCVSVHQDLLDAVDTNVPTKGFVSRSDARINLFGS